jgi:hypothetical protein
VSDASTSSSASTPPRLVFEVDGDDAATVAAQLPGADTLAPGTRVVVLGGKSRGWLGKVLPPRGAPPPGAIGSALLARGYVGIASGDERGRDATRAEAPK